LTHHKTYRLRTDDHFTAVPCHAAIYCGEKNEPKQQQHLVFSEVEKY
jgi:hypothetical protein